MKVQVENSGPAAARRRRPVLRRGGRGLAVLFVIVVVLAAAGAVYQALGARADARNYPPPGELVSVGSHRLHLHCMGEGSPTVILEALAGRSEERRVGKECRCRGSACAETESRDMMSEGTTRRRATRT